MWNSKYIIEDMQLIFKKSINTDHLKLTKKK